MNGQSDQANNVYMIKIHQICYEKDKTKEINKYNNSF